MACQCSLSPQSITAACYFGLGLLPLCPVAAYFHSWLSLLSSIWAAHADCHWVITVACTAGCQCVQSLWLATVTWQISLPQWLFAVVCLRSLRLYPVTAVWHCRLPLACHYKPPLWLVNSNVFTPKNTVCSPLRNNT